MAQAEAKDRGERTVLSMHDTILETLRFKSDIEYRQNARRKAKDGDPDQSAFAYRARKNSEQEIVVMDRLSIRVCLCSS